MATFRRKGGGGRVKAPDGPVFLLTEQREKMRIFWLLRRERGGVFDRHPERIFVDAVGGDTGSAAVDDGADGNDEALFGNMLVNGVIGEAGEGVDGFVNLDFRFANAK